VFFLSYKNHLDMLKHACENYVMKYLSTIRRVLDKCHNFEAEGDCFSSNNGENQRYKQRDLM